MKDGTPHLTGDLAIDAFDLEPLAAMVVGDAGTAAGAAANGRRWRSSRRRRLPFTADLDLTFGSVVGRAVRRDRGCALQAAVAADGVRLSDDQGQARRRRADRPVRGQEQCRQRAGLDAVQARRRRSRSAARGSGLTGKGDVGASLSAAGKSVEALFASLSGSGTATVRGLERARHQPGRVPGDSCRRRQDGPRHRRHPRRRLCAADRCRRQLRRAARATSPSRWPPACCALRRSR